MIHQYSVQEVRILCIYTYTVYIHMYTHLNIYINLFNNWKVCEYSVSTERSKRLNQPELTPSISADLLRDTQTEHGILVAQVVVSIPAEWLSALSRQTPQGCLTKTSQLFLGLCVQGRSARKTAPQPGFWDSRDYPSPLQQDRGKPPGAQTEALIVPLQAQGALLTAFIHNLLILECSSFPDRV